jgi:type I restriction enzyme M protein
LHGFEDFKIVRGDTLRNPAFFEGDELQTFDCVIANPPFSLKEWGADSWANDRYGRNIAGVPPKGNGDMAWVQHMIKSMKPDTGRMTVVLPQGVLFRQGAESKIRKTLIELDLLEAVIGIGSNIFYGTQLAPSILVFNNNKVNDKKSRVMFIDASEQLKIGRAQNTLEKEHVNQIFEWFVVNQDIENFAKVVELKEIKENDYNLNIPLYVEKIINDNLPTVEEAMTDLKESWKSVQEAEEIFKQKLKEFRI